MFTARSQAFRDFLEPLLTAGHVAVWRARFAEIRDGQLSASRAWDETYPHYVGSPRMNAMGKQLAAGLDIRLGTNVSRIRRAGARWRLLDADGEPLGEFDWVLLTAPAEQTLKLAPDIPDLAGLCREGNYA